MCNPIWTAWECAWSIYFPQLLFLIIGGATALFGLMSKDSISILSDSKPFIKIKDIELNPTLPKTVRLGFIYIGAISFLVGFLWILIIEFQTPFVNKLSPTPMATGFASPTPIPISTTTLTIPAPTTVLPISLINMGYIVGDWNPRVIDLLTVGEKGISVSPKVSLRFFDLWVSIPSQAHNYFIGSEVYGDGELIGTTGFQQVNNELVKLNEIQVDEKYADPDVESGKAWEMNWKKIDLYIYLYPNDQPGQKSISTSHTVIKIQPGDLAWFIKPPYSHFVAIEYVINDGQTQTIDPRSILDEGLPLSTGDQITFTKIWYKADTDSYGHQIQVECYLTPDDYNGDRLKSTKFFTQTKGVSEIPNLTDFNWTVLDAEKYIVITLTRDDGTVLDRYVIPILQ